MEIVIPLSPKIVLVALFVLLTEHCLDEEVYFYPFRLATVIHISILLGNMVFLFKSMEVSAMLYVSLPKNLQGMSHSFRGRRWTLGGSVS